MKADGGEGSKKSIALSDENSTSYSSSFSFPAPKMRTLCTRKTCERKNIWICFFQRGGFSWFLKRNTFNFKRNHCKNMPTKWRSKTGQIFRKETTFRSSCVVPHHWYFRYRSWMKFQQDWEWRFLWERVKHFFCIREDNHINLEGFIFFSRHIARGKILEIFFAKTIILTEWLKSVQASIFCRLGPCN